MKEINLAMVNNENNDLASFLIDEVKKINEDTLNSFLYDRVPINLFNRAVERSTDYAEKNMSGITVFTSSYKPKMWDYAISKLKVDGYIAEFGVFKGESVNYLAKLVDPKTIFGFDSFKGLEEDFSIDYGVGGFNQNGIAPTVEKNVFLVKGSFLKTLPNWLNKNKGVFSFINIDCDTYKSTSDILNLIGPDRIVSGTMILFDEYFGFYGWEDQEFKAWKDYCSNNNVKYKYVAICHMQVLVEVL
jgi:hypothetical protein